MPDDLASGNDAVQDRMVAALDHADAATSQQQAGSLAATVDVAQHRFDADAGSTTQAFNKAVQPADGLVAAQEGQSAAEPPAADANEARMQAALDKADRERRQRDGVSYAASVDVASRPQDADIGLVTAEFNVASVGVQAKEPQGEHESARSQSTGEGPRPELNVPAPEIAMQEHEERLQRILDAVDQHQQEAPSQSLDNAPGLHR